ncbi:MAG: PRD domain-containing protein [Tissierellia bacterium]|nr:PRD domain-containing protein [Tissierellia bacterium]
MKWFEYDSRILTILNFLEKGPISSKKLEKELNVSKRSIKNDIKQLNELLSSSAIIREKEGKYRIFIFELAKFHKKRDLIIRENKKFEYQNFRLAFILDTLKDGETYLTDELAYAMSVSRSTIIRDIERLRFFLSEYGVEIIGLVNKGIELRGSELGFRLFVFEKFYDEIYLSTENEIAISSIVDKYLFDKKIDLDTLNNLTRFINISVERLRKNKSIVKLSDKYKKLETHQYFDLIKQMAKEIESKFKVKFKNNEIIYFMIPISGMSTPVINKKLEFINIPESIDELVVDILNEIRQKMDIQISFEEVRKDFVYHLFFLLNRLQYGYKVTNPILSDIKRDYKLAYKLAKIASDVIEKNSGFDMSESEISYICAYFQIYITEEKMKVKSVGSIALILDRGGVSALMVKTIINEVFESDTKIDVFDYMELKSIDMKKYELIITNIKDVKSVNALVVYNKDLSDIESLKLKLEEIRITKKINLNTKLFLNSILLKTLKKDDFMILESDSYEKNLDLMLERLKQKNKIDQLFIEKIKEREKKASMVFDCDIAFPHTRNDNQLLISMALTPKSKDSIKIIFLAGIPHANYNPILLNLYDEIVEISTNKESILSLYEAKDYDQFIKNLILKTNLFR